MTDSPECPSEASMSEEESCQEGQAYSRDYISIGLEMAAGWTHLWMPVVSPKGKCQKESWYLDWSIWHPVVLHPGMFVCLAIKHSHISITDTQLGYTLLSDVPVSQVNTSVIDIIKHTTNCFQSCIEKYVKAKYQENAHRRNNGCHITTGPNQKKPNFDIWFKID